MRAFRSASLLVGSLYAAWVSGCAQADDGPISSTKLGFMLGILLIVTAPSMEQVTISRIPGRVPMAMCCCA